MAVRTIARPDARQSRTRLPGAVWLLAAGAFLMVTAELLVAGLLPQIADGLSITEAQTGLLVTVFAFGIASGAPLLTVLTLRLPRRTTLGLAMSLFAVGQIVLVVSDDFTVALIARFVTAFAAGGFWAVAAVVATRMADPSATARALAVTYSGGNLANVLGAPFGSALGQVVGWRGAFAGLAVLVLVVAVAVVRAVPADRVEHRRAGIVREVAALRSGRLWLVFLVSAGVNGGVLAVYSFLSPLLLGRTGLPDPAVPVGLALFGGGAVLGTVLAARFSDRFPRGTLLTATGLTFVLILLLLPLSTSPVLTFVLLGLLGTTAYLGNPMLVAMAVRYGGDAPNMATAFATTAFNLGVTVTTVVAAGALASAGPIGPVVIGAVVSGLLLVPLLALLRLPHVNTPVVASGSRPSLPEVS